MSTAFRRTRPATPEEFVSGAKTAIVDTPAVQPTLVQPVQVDAGIPELNPRVMRQVNIDVPETLHHELRQLVDTIPRMSMRKFILEAVAEKMAAVRAGRPG